MLVWTFIHNGGFSALVSESGNLIDDLRRNGGISFLYTREEWQSEERKCSYEEDIENVFFEEQIREHFHVVEYNIEEKYDREVIGIVLKDNQGFNQLGGVILRGDENDLAQLVVEYEEVPRLESKVLWHNIPYHLRADDIFLYFGHSHEDGCSEENMCQYCIHRLKYKMHDPFCTATHMCCWCEMNRDSQESAVYESHFSENLMEKEIEPENIFQDEKEKN